MAERMRSVTSPYCGTLGDPKKFAECDANARGPTPSLHQAGREYYALMFPCCKRVGLAYAHKDVIRRMWPAPLPVSAPNHLPAAVLAGFNEAATCLANSLPRACVLMIRRCIEAACEDKACKKDNLYLSID